MKATTNTHQNGRTDTDIKTEAGITEHVSYQVCEDALTSFKSHYNKMMSEMCTRQIESGRDDTPIMLGFAGKLMSVVLKDVKEVQKNLQVLDAIFQIQRDNRVDKTERVLAFAKILQTLATTKRDMAFRVDGGLDKSMKEHFGVGLEVIWEAESFDECEYAC